MKRLHPHADNVLVLFAFHDPNDPAHPSNRRTAGGLYVPESVAAAEPVETVTARVIDHGPGHFDDYGRWIPMDPGIRVGALVLIEGKSAATLAGQPVFIGGVEHRVVRENEIGAVFE